jgi:hypothetical protein
VEDDVGVCEHRLQCCLVAHVGPRVLPAVGVSIGQRPQVARPDDRTLGAQVPYEVHPDLSGGSREYRPHLLLGFGVRHENDVSRLVLRVRGPEADDARPRLDPTDRAGCACSAGCFPRQRWSILLVWPDTLLKQASSDADR